MALLKANRGVQWPLVATFEINFDDTMVDIAGVTRDFGKTTTAGGGYSFDVINLPPNSIVLGGSFTTITTFDTAGWDLKVGDSGTADRYLGSTDVKTAGTLTPLVPTGFLNATGLNIRIWVQNDDTCTTGRGILNVQYIVLNRATEVQAA